ISNLYATRQIHPKISLNAISFAYFVFTGTPEYLLLQAILNNPWRTCRSVAVAESNPPCIVALIAQSRYFVGEPKGSRSIIEPLSFFVEYALKNLQTSFSEVWKFCKLLIAADFSHNFIALGLTSLQITLSVFFISLATLSPLAPSPDKPSRKIFGPWKFFKKAGSLGGTFSSIDPHGTRILVAPSVISIISFTLVCNQNSKIISPIMVL